jgi:hypothetical protein
MNFMDYYLSPNWQALSSSLGSVTDSAGVLRNYKTKSFVFRDLGSCTFVLKPVGFQSFHSFLVKLFFAFV